MARGFSETPVSAWCRECGVREGAAPPGHGLAPGAAGAELRTPRGQKDKGAARSGGRRQRREDRQRAGCYARYAIYRFISPGCTEGKQRTASEGLRYTWGEEVFLSPDEPRSFGSRFSLPGRCARRRENLSALGGGAGRAAEFRVPSTGIPVSPGGERVAAASSLLISAGLILFPTQRRSLSPFNNL